jgi:hypothetical protein
MSSEVARPCILPGITNLLAVSDTCLVSSIDDGYRPVGLSLDLGELIFINPRLRKFKASDSAHQINERLEHLQRTGKWISTTTAAMPS